MTAEIHPLIASAIATAARHGSLSAKREPSEVLAAQSKARTAPDTQTLAALCVLVDNRPLHIPSVADYYAVQVAAFDDNQLRPSDETCRRATKFLNALHHAIPAPSVAIDANGDITLEWIDTATLTLTIDATELISYWVRWPSYEAARHSASGVVSHDFMLGLLAVGL